MTAALRGGTRRTALALLVSTLAALTGAAAPTAAAAPSPTAQPNAAAAHTATPQPQPGTTPQPSVSVPTSTTATPTPTGRPSQPSPNPDEDTDGAEKDDEKKVRPRGGMVDELGGDTPVSARAPSGRRIPLSRFAVYYELPDTADTDSGQLTRAICGTLCVITHTAEQAKTWMESGVWRLWAALLELSWTAVIWMVFLACWLITWGLDFGLAETLAAPIDALTSYWQNRIVDPIGVHGFVITVAGAWVAILLLTGRYRDGARRLALSAVVAGIAGTLLLDPGTRVLGDDGILGQARSVSVDIAAVTAPGPVPDDARPDQVGDAVAVSLIDALVVKPHQTLNYGRVLPKGSCTSRYWASLTSDDVASHDEWLRMHCAVDDFDRPPTLDRAMAAHVLFLGGLLVIIMAVVIVLTILGGQAMAAYYAVFTLVAFTGGIAFPRLIRSWLAGIIRAVFMVIVPVIVLTGYVSVANAILTADTGLSVLGRFAVLDCLSIAALVFRRRLARGAKALAIRGADAVERFGNARATPGYDPGRGRSTGSKLMSAYYAQRQATTLARGAGRVGTGVSRLARGTAKYALMSTVGLPLYGPRAAAAMKKAATAKAGTFKAAGQECIGNIRYGTKVITGRRGQDDISGHARRHAPKPAAPKPTPGSSPKSTPSTPGPGRNQKPRPATTPPPAKASGQTPAGPPPLVVSGANRRPRTRPPESFFPSSSSS